jgi:drug/metabolite transporter (DMT)-like permease
MGWSSATSGVLMALAAAVCQTTGTAALTSGGDTVNTHTPATWVLAVVGAVLLVNGLVLVGAARSATSGRGDAEQPAA